jgi:hypothetical protein
VALVAGVVVLMAVVSLASRAPLSGPLLPASVGRGMSTILHRRGLGTTAPRLPVVSPGSRGTVIPTSTPSSTSPPVWLEVLAAAIFVGGALIFLVRSRPDTRRVTGQVAAPSPSPAEALRAAVDVSLEDVRSDPNARRAVIGAYRLMETTLARAGLPRSQSEAPREDLTRALGSVRVGDGPPQRLTALYERAKFSVAEVDLRLRDEAIDALLTLRTELA